MRLKWDGVSPIRMLQENLRVLSGKACDLHTNVGGALYKSEIPPLYYLSGSIYQCEESTAKLGNFLKLKMHRSKALKHGGHTC